jgi:uncharacterized protein YyaL (SSP411 family)
MFTVQSFGADITTNLEVTPNVILDSGAPVLSQTEHEEFNISSYKDFADATSDLLVSKLMNSTDGAVYTGSNHDWEILQLLSSTANYYWAISALNSSYHATNNETYANYLSRAAIHMIDRFMDPLYPGFYINDYSNPEVGQTKRAGVQAYAYWALDIAEKVNATLDFTAEKQSAITCLTDVLYDDVYGGFHFFTMRNGSLTIPPYFFEIYPNDGKRLDHLALGADVLYDAGVASGNTTLIDIADEALNFLYVRMRYYFEAQYVGLRLAVDRDGAILVLAEGLRPGHTVVTDINAIAMRALLKGYLTTGNTTYLELAEDTFDALLTFNWDSTFGGWFAETLDGVPYDPLDDEDVKYFKYSEIQFQMVLTLEMMYEISLEQLPLQLTIDILDLVLLNLWEEVDEGFVRNGNQEWDVLDEVWEQHFTAVQAQGILSLYRMAGYGLPIVSNVRIQPISPRPHDPIGFIATALDSDGINMVYVNYTTNTNGTLESHIVILESNPIASGVYNNTIAPLPDQTSCNFIVVANDTTGREFIAGSYFFIVEADTFAPVVTLSAIFPTDEVRVGDDVTIEFEVFEHPSHSWVWTCQLWWRVNSAPSFTRTNMTYVGLDGNRHLLYQINIGQFNAGDKVEFEGHIEDEAGNIGISMRHILTILGPEMNVTPISAWQIGLGVALVAAPGAYYGYNRFRKRDYVNVQKEGKRAARKKARRRGPRRRR